MILKKNFYIPIMENNMQRPEHPQPGFYYHYKHDPSKPLNNYAYEVLNIGSHTETDEYMVIYRPLYPSSVYLAGKMLDVRPHAMFMENVIVDGIEKMRFTPITDPETIRQLEVIKKEMY